MIRISLVIALWLWCGQLQAQKYDVVTEQLLTEDGLSNRFVYAMVQDSRGYMWFGTKGGLNRYDGSRFDVFKVGETKLQSDPIKYLCEDKDGYLWVFHSSRLDAYVQHNAIDIVNIHTLVIQSVEDYLGQLLPFKMENLRQIQSDPKTNYIYCTTVSGTVWVYEGAKKWRIFYQQPERKFLASLLIGKQYIWLAYRGGGVALNQAGEVVYQTKLPLPPVDDISHNDYQLVGELDSNAVWIQLPKVKGGWNFHWKPIEGQLEEQSKGQPKAPSMLYNSRMIYCKKSQCYIHYNYQKFQLYNQQFELIYEEDYPIRNHSIATVYVDRQENIWVSVLANGITKISYKKRRFANTLPQESIRGMFFRPQDSLLLVNSYNGRWLLGRHQLEAGQNVRQIQANPNTLLHWSKKRNTLLSNMFGSYILQLDQLGEQEEKHYYVRKAIKQRQGKELGDSYRGIWALHEMNNGDLWIGTDLGLAVLPFNADSIELPFAWNDYRNLFNSVVNHFHQNETGLWIATSTGLYLMDADTNFIHYHSGKSPPYQLPFNDLIHLYEDEQGVFYLATRGGGWVIFDPKTGDFQQWTTADGLAHNTLYATLEDDYGYFWVSSDQGLMRIKPETNFIQIFLPINGLPHEEFNREAAYKTPDGYLYFGGLSGVTEINPKDFLEDDNIPLPPMYVVDYQYFDGDQGIMVDGMQRLQDEGQINLAYEDRVLNLTFGLLVYHVGGRKRYAYQIEGDQDKWIYTEEPTIQIKGLRVGTYRLNVKAALSNGTWSPVLITYPIVIHQPFYLQLPFLMGMGLLIVLIAVLFTVWRERRARTIQRLLEEKVRKRTQTIREQADALKKTDELKSRFFANISHELRTPLTLILGPVEGALNTTKAFHPNQTTQLLRLIQRNGLRLKNLIEQILQLSKLESSQVSLEEAPQSMAELIQSLWSNFEWQAKDKEIYWVLEQQVPAGLQGWMDADKVEKIVNNLLSNALKHTPKGGTIALSSEWNSTLSVWQVAVKDTGRGIPEHELERVFDRFYQAQNGQVMGGTGIGLALCQELTKLMDGAITVESTLGKGSTFTVQLPLKLIKRDDLVSTQKLPEALVLPDKATHQATILIVEDHTDLRLYLSDLIGNYYKVCTAADGQEALELLNSEEWKVDLVVSDVMMPRMDGFELLTRLRALLPEQQIPVILLTARTAQRDRLQALRIGVDDYLTKPFSHQELFARIHNLLTSHFQRLAWQQEWKAQPTDSTVDEQPTETTPLVEEVQLPQHTTDAWLENLEAIVTREVGNAQFNVSQLAYDLHLSERQLRRKIKTKTGLTPNQYFRRVKLEIARQYLEDRAYRTVAEVAYEVGFSSAHYFSKIYLAQYGKKPIEYLR